MSHRYRWLAVSVIVLGLAPALVRADAFDNYINPILAKVPEAKDVEKITKLTPATMVEHSRALPGITAAFIVVKTNDNRFAKLLVMPGEQKIGPKKYAPIIIIQRYVTYREGEERVVHASGQSVHLFGDFRFNLDIGQIVPKDVGADLRVGVDKDGFFLEPIGKAEIYLVTKHLAEANPGKPKKLEVGAKFEMRYFNGAYKLYDDGRRSGKLEIKVAENGDISGFYYSDKDGKKYDVDGKISNASKHKIDFRIQYPQTIQDFSGYLFTGDGRAITGTSTLENLTTGFYAVRIEE
jgi:hypothetical protein